MADEENEVKPISDKVLCVHDENMMEDETKPDIVEDKDTKIAEPKSENNEDKKEDEENEEEEDDDEEDEDKDEETESLPPGLLEQPLEVEGKRQKKKVERLSATMMRSVPEKQQLEIEEGAGTKLGDIPYVAHYINVTKASDLKSLHKLLFLRAGTLNEIKRNIRKFSGTNEAKDSKEHDRRLAVANKMSLTELKGICLWLGVKHTGTKGDLTERMMSFLEKPEDQGAEIKKKRNKSKPVAKKGTKRKRKTKKTEKEDKPKKKAKKNKGEREEKKKEDDEEDETEEEEMDDEEESEEDADEEDSDYETPKKKKPKLDVKKKEKKTKKTAKENGKKEKASPKKVKASPKKEKTPAKTKKKETKKATPRKEMPDLSDSLSDDSDDSDNEVLAKAAKPPSDDEIKNAVKNILDGADLETVTMKTVVKQVYAKYPRFDLSDRKDFIKSAVREVIS